MQILRGRRTDIGCLAISPDSRYVAVGGYPEYHVWDLHETKLKARPLCAGKIAVHKLYFSSTTELFACDVHRCWHRHDLLKALTLQLSFPGHNGGREAIVYPDGTRLKAMLPSGYVEDFRVVGSTLASVGSAVEVGGLFKFIDFDLSGNRYIAIAAWSQSRKYEYQIFDSATDSMLRILELPRYNSSDPASFAFSPDGRLTFATVKGQTYAYDYNVSGTPVAMCETPDRSYHGPLAVHPDGRIVVTVENGQAVTFRDADTLQVLRTYDFNMPKVTCVAFTPDGTRCVVGNSRGKVLLFDVE